jgi:hypothetical protein
VFTGDCWPKANPDEPWPLPGRCPKLKGDELVAWLAVKVSMPGNFEVPNVKGDEGVAGWVELSTFPNVKAGLGWSNPDPDELNVNPEGGLGFSNLLSKGLESPEAVPKLNGEPALSLFWPKLSTRPPMNELSLGRGVETSTTLVGLSSILTSSSSLGGVTGRGKLPNGGLWDSAAMEFVPKVKTPEVDALWAGWLNCGAVGFSGEVEVAPSLKVNEKPGFVSFGTSLWAIAGGLADSPGDWAGIDCSGVNNFVPSVELVAPNPANGVPDELPNENIDDVGPFCSGFVSTELVSTLVVVVWIFVESGAEL